MNVEPVSSSTSLVQLTAEIVASYVQNNSIGPNEIPTLISTVHSSLTRTMSDKSETNTNNLVPAVPIKKSITDDYIICLEDGKKFKSLKRHLHTHYNMTAEQYRERWGLPNDYPMVAPNYAKKRSRLAKKMGLGQQRSRPASV